MRLSYKWLSEYVDLSGITPEELAEKMTTAGLEVEGIEPMAKGSNLVIGEVMECEDIPETHLHATVTRIGPNPEDVTKIVCGAPNCRKGLKVIAALPGAELPGGTITAKPLRGYESNGMLCALYELGVDKKNLTEYQLSGIEELPADFAPCKRGASQVGKRVGEKRIVVPRREVGTNEAKPAEQVGVIGSPWKHEPELPEADIAMGNTQAQEEAREQNQGACDATGLEAHALEQRIQQRGRTHAEDDAKADGRVDRRKSRGDIDGGGQEKISPGPS